MAGGTDAGAGAAAEVPGLVGVPLLGSLFDLKSDSLGTYLRAQHQHGDLVRVTAGPPGMRAELYCVFSPEGAQQVLASEAANFRKDNAFYQEVRDSFGNGLLTSQDEDYLRQRRLVQPLFTRRRVDGYAGAVAAETASVIAAWDKAPDGVVDVSDEMTHLALRAVARILFGTDVEATAEAVARCFPVITDYVLRRGYSPPTSRGTGPPRATGVRPPRWTSSTGCATRSSPSGAGRVRTPPVGAPLRRTAQCRTTLRRTPLFRAAPARTC